MKIRMVIIKSLQCLLTLERVWRKKNLPTLLVGMKIGAATMKNHMEDH